MEENNLMIGKVVEFKNAKKETIQRGKVLDKVLYKEKAEDTFVSTGYLIEEEESKAVRVVKPIRIMGIVDNKGN